MARCGAWFVLLALATGTASAAPVSADERFVESLSRGSDEPLDRKQLAGLFARVATTLDRGKAALNAAWIDQLPTTRGAADSNLLRERLTVYERNATAFVGHAQQLAEEPNSRLAFYQAWTSGQRTCWTLDLFARLAEMRSADAERQQVLLPSREACALFRSAVFQPRVEAILQEALVEQVYERNELNDLRREVRELEQMVEELIRNESGK